MSLEKLEDNLYVLHGGCSCGNTTFYITDAGVVMVDTKVAGTGEAILEQLRTVTDKPIAMIINTHTHFDHTESNTEFGAVDRIVTHANAKKSLMKATCSPATNCDAFKGDNAKHLPNVTFDDKRTLTIGSDQIDLYYFGGGHTDGDAGRGHSSRPPSSDATRSRNPRLLRPQGVSQNPQEKLLKFVWGNALDQLREALVLR
jgi:glyoxylase-like metal-dependent hydrolase (beta-lactamase superfamily II)